MQTSTLSAPAQNETIRRQTLDAAKQYKASWIELGRYLYTIYKDKHYKSWGFLSFEAYCIKELSMKQTTAAKLLKSYFFLEKEEPRMVSKEYLEDETPKKVPDYESVNLLRLAKENKSITSNDYADLRDAVINDAKEPKEFRAQVKKVIESKDTRDEKVVRMEKRNTQLKRLLTLLSQVKREFSSENLLPAYLIKQIDELSFKLQDQLRD